MLKTELHAHTSADTEDYIPHTTTQLIDRAAELDYDVLAITLHDTVLDVAPFRRYARDRGVTLLTGVERSVQHKHILLINFGPGAERVHTFDHIRELKRAQPAGIVVAPHPFYPGRSCLGHLLEEHRDVFDAVEWNAFYTAQFTRFNDQAAAWAARHGKAVVANGDVHRLAVLGTTYSMVDAPPDADAICAAIRRGNIEIRTTPLSTVAATLYFSDLMIAKLFRSPLADCGSISP